MIRHLLLFLLGLSTGGCGQTAAVGYDSADPVNCLTIFGIAGAGGAQRSDARLTDEMGARMMYLVSHHGGVAWLNAVAPQSRRLAAVLEAAHDGPAVLGLVKACSARQNADPAFRAAAPALLRQLAEGRAKRAARRR